MVTQCAATFDNGKNLSPDFIAALKARWAGTAPSARIAQRIDRRAGRRASADAAPTSKRCARPDGAFDRVVVAVDPPASVDRTPTHAALSPLPSAAKVARKANQWCLADTSVQAPCRTHLGRARGRVNPPVSAHAIVAEANNGGEDGARRAARRCAGDLRVGLCTRAKASARAEPIAALYAQACEARRRLPCIWKMRCAFGARAFQMKAPDRLDTLVGADGFVARRRGDARADALTKDNDA